MRDEGQRADVPDPSATGTSHLLEALRNAAISSNVHPGGVDQLLPATIATTAVDRFMHHAHVVVTDGGSYRFAHARDGKAVTPLGGTQAGRTDGHQRGQPMATSGEK